MKTFFKLCFYLAIGSMLFACTPSELQGTSTNGPTATATISNKNSIQPTATFLDASSLPTFPAPTIASNINPMPTVSFGLPTVVFNTTPVVGTPPTPSLDQMQYPYFEQTAIPGLLQSHLTIETLPGFNGHNLQRISGWEFGFKSLEWMDADHLLLYPVTGGDKIQPLSYPAVANLDSNTFWTPLPSRRAVNNHSALPRWSPQLGALVAVASDTSIGVYSPDGEVRKIYEGEFLGISPSATKLLIGDTWIDLDSAKAVDFAWDQTGVAADDSGNVNMKPIWSPDEMRVYACCYRYGDARTGVGLVMPYYGTTFQEKKEIPAVFAYGGTWVLKDKYLLPIWEGVWDGRYGAVYLFDPAAKVYRNLSELSGVRYQWQGEADPYCTQPSAQNGGRYVWVDCMDGGHLIDVATFRSRAYPPPADGPYGGGYYNTRDTQWSADGSFVWFNEEGAESILSGVTGEMKSLPTDCYGFEWHPKDNVLLCMSVDDQRLLLLDAQSLSVKREFDLPAKFGWFSWSPDGKHVDLVASDKSLWRVDYPRLDNFKQLTPPLSQLVGQNNSIPLTSNPLWSPDHTAMAIRGTDGIYIVHVNGAH